MQRRKAGGHQFDKGRNALDNKILRTSLNVRNYISYHSFLIGNSDYFAFPKPVASPSRLAQFMTSCKMSSFQFSMSPLLGSFKKNQVFPEAKVGYFPIETDPFGLLNRK